MKRNHKASVILSLLIGGVFVLLLLAISCILPPLVRSLLSAPDLIGDRQNLPPAIPLLILVLSYGAIAVALAAVGLLFALLRLVDRGEVFSTRAVRLLSFISLCCFAEGVIFLAIGVWFQLALILCAAAVFLGLCLRIVSSVIAEATHYKAENDLTV